MLADLKARSLDAPLTRRWFILVGLMVASVAVTIMIAAQTIVMLHQRRDLARQAAAARLDATAQVLRQRIALDLVTLVVPPLVRSVFGQAVDVARPPALAAFRGKVLRGLARCQCVDTLALALRVDTSGAWVATDESPGIRLDVQGLADSLRKQVTLTHLATSYVVGHGRGRSGPSPDSGVVVSGFLVTPPPGPARLFAYVAYAPTPPGPQLIYALELDASSVLAWAIDSSMHERPPVAADSEISVEARDASGRQLLVGARRDATDSTPVTIFAPDLGSIALKVFRKGGALPGPVSGPPVASMTLLLSLLGLSIGLMAVSLMQLHGELRLARLQARFVSGVSHELRTPLAQIRLFAELLQDPHGGGDPHVRDYARIIDDESQRLTNLVDNVLAFATLGDSGADRGFGPVPLSTLVEETADRFRPLAAATDATVVTSIVPHIQVRGSGDGLRRILINLLDNASKYGPRGQSIRVSLDVTGSSARLTVDDGGLGVPSVDRQRVFNPYVRLDAAADRASGSGIGLAVVRQIVTIHSGVVWIDEAPDGGCRVVVAIPLLDPVASESARDALANV